MPKFTVFVLLLAVALKPVPAQAFTVAEAQTCGDTLLTAYNNKTYPKKLLAVEKIVRKAFGANYRALSKGEIALALSVSEEYLRTSFTEPTGKFQYRDLVVESVEVTTVSLAFVSWVK